MRFAITLQKNFQSSKKENLPPKPATPDTFFSKLGSHDRQKKKLDEERKKEYNQLLQQVWKVFVYQVVLGKRIVHTVKNLKKKWNMEIMLFLCLSYLKHISDFLREKS